MSSIEIRLAPGIDRRRQEISDIDAQLGELNLRFRDQRKKPDAEKDPEYMAQRGPLLARRLFYQNCSTKTEVR